MMTDCRRQPSAEQAAENPGGDHDTEVPLGELAQCIDQLDPGSAGQHRSHIPSQHFGRLGLMAAAELERQDEGHEPDDPADRRHRCCLHANDGRCHLGALERRGWCHWLRCHRNPKCGRRGSREEHRATSRNPLRSDQKRQPSRSHGCEPAEAAHQLQLRIRFDQLEIVADDRWNHRRTRHLVGLGEHEHRECLRKQEQAVIGGGRHHRDGHQTSQRHRREDDGSVAAFHPVHQRADERTNESERRHRQHQPQQNLLASLSRVDLEEQGAGKRNREGCLSCHPCRVAHRQPSERRAEVLGSVLSAQTQEW